MTIPVAMTRYTAITERAIAKCLQDYEAGRDLGQALPSMTADQVAIVVAEALEANQLILQPREALIEQANAGQGSDWALACLFEMFDTWRSDIDPDDDVFAASHRDEYETVAYTALEHVLNSPTASPMVGYEQIYFDISQRYRLSGDRRALDFMRRGLRYDLEHYQAGNAPNFLRDVAQIHLWLDDLDEGLTLLTHLLRYDPADIWSYNRIALTFDKFGLTRLGSAAINRGLALIKSQGKNEELTDQLRDKLEDMNTAEKQGREAEVSPAVLASFEQALALDFEPPADTSAATISALCYRLIPELKNVPLKTPKQPPTLKPASPATRPGRNQPCWCGSGKKYKHCHLRQDQAG